MGTAYVFRRKFGVPTPQHTLAGHVGWAFQLDHDAGIFCGSTENPDAHPFHAAGEDNGWWAKTVSSENELFDEMRHRTYDDFKSHTFALVRPDKAMFVANNCRLIGYSFTGNNCLDHTYEVLFHYGALDMPIPPEYGYPNAWFSALAWEEHSLKQADATQEDGTPILVR